MNQKNLIIICITAIICVSIISVAAVMMTKNESTTNNTTNETVNVTLNDSNSTNNTTTTQTTKKSATTTKSKQESEVREEDKITSDGWNPKEHEINRVYVGDGIERVDFDDGYHRWVDKKGNVLSYGYG